MTLRPRFQLAGHRSRLGVRSLIAALGLSAGLVASHAGLGCGGTLGGECILPSDCGESLVCVDQYCHQECAATRDCYNDGDICFKDEELDVGYCAPPTPCTESADCREGQACREKTCRDTCQKNADCTGSQQCFQFVCYESCDKDSDCREGLCFEHKCAGGEPQYVRGELGMPCAIPSDCVSGNCIDSTCVGCRVDSDCPGQGRCDNPNPDDMSEAVCWDDECVPAKPSVEFHVVGTDKYSVLDATSSDGEVIYFTGFISDEMGYPDYYGIFRIDLNNNEGVTSLCTYPPADPFDAADRISISSDDQFLYVTKGPGGLNAIYRTSSISSGCDLALVEGTQGMYPRAIDVVDDGSGGDTVYFAGGDSSKGLYSFPASKMGVGAVGHVLSFQDVNIGPFAVDANTRMFAVAQTLTAAALVTGGAKEGLQVLKDNLGIGPVGVALDHDNETTIYVAGYDALLGQGRLLALGTSDHSCTQFSAELLLGVPGSQGGSSLHRARKKNTFLWIAQDGKLYQFDL